MDTPALFFDTAEAFVALVSEIPHDAWDRLGLGVWDVRSLVGHTARAITTVTDYLPHRPDAVELGSAAEYLAAGFRSDPAAHAAVAARGVAAGHELGDEPAEVIETMIERVRASLATIEDDPIIEVRLGAMRLNDYLETRIVELVVHISDIAAATGLTAHLPSAALERTLQVITAAALLNDRGIAAVRQLSGRDGSTFDLM
jgi:hypothetical protein